MNDRWYRRVGRKSYDAILGNWWPRVIYADCSNCANAQHPHLSSKCKNGRLRAIELAHILHALQMLENYPIDDPMKIHFTLLKKDLEQLINGRVEYRIDIESPGWGQWAYEGMIGQIWQTEECLDCNSTPSGYAHLSMECEFGRIRLQRLAEVRHMMYMLEFTGRSKARIKFAVEKWRLKKTINSPAIPYSLNVWLDDEQLTYGEYNTVINTIHKNRDRSAESLLNPNKKESVENMDTMRSD